MKKLFLSLFLILSSLAFSQSTNVSFQVTDTDGQTWNNGTWVVQIQPLTGTIATNTFKIAATGAPVPNLIQSGALNGSGQGSVTVTPNSAINPVGSQWSFTVCPQANSPCFTLVTFIFGATQSLTIAPTAIRINATRMILAYTDAEVSTGLGQLYYNIVGGTLRVCTQVICNGTGFSAISGGGGTGCVVNPDDSGCAIAGSPSVDLFIGAVGSGTGWLVQLLSNGLNVKVPIAVIGSGASGGVNLGYGTDPGNGSGVSLIAQPSGTPWRMRFAASADSGFWVCTNLSNLVDCGFQSDINLPGDITGILDYAHGGTNSATQGAALINLLPAIVRNGDLVTAQGSNWIICPGNTGGGSSTGFYTENGTGNCGYVQSPIPVLNGGSGLNNIPSNTILRGNGTGNESAASISDDGTHTTFGGGIVGDGAGFKHKRGTAGCATAASAGAVCTTVITWTTTFADASYTPHCWGRVVTSGVPVNGAITTFNASTVTFTTVAVTAAAAQFTNIDCEAVHD